MVMAMLTLALCPNCQSTLTLDSEERAAICPFCGKPFVVQDAIEAYQKSGQTNASTTSPATMSSLQFLELEKKQKADDALFRVKQLQNEGNYSAAREKCKKIIDDIDPRNAEAWHTLLEISFLQYQWNQMYHWNQLLGDKLGFPAAFLSAFLIGESASGLVDKIMFGQNPGAKDALLAIEGSDAFQIFFDKYVQKVKEAYTVYRQKLTSVSGHTDWVSPLRPWYGCIGNFNETIVKACSYGCSVTLERLCFFKKYVELKATYRRANADSATDSYTYTLKYLWNDSHTLVFDSGKKKWNATRSWLQDRVKPEEVISTIKLLPYRYDHLLFFYLEPKSAYTYTRYYSEIIQGKIIVLDLK